jgi:acyl-CoA hydrolase
MVKEVGDRLGNITFTGIFVPSFNRRTWLPNRQCRLRTYFMTPELREARAQVDFLPLCYTDILTNLKASPIDVALFSVSPPDKDGMCSFGPTVDFLPEIWEKIPIRIAHINPGLPRTPGHSGIPWSAITAFVERTLAPPIKAAEMLDDVSHAIGVHAAAYVPDGATLQMGLGKAPAAVVRALNGKKNLSIHSGLIDDSVLHLLNAGALASDAAITAGVAIGSPALYAAIRKPPFNFQPITITHGADSIAKLRNFVSLNSALEVDLFGQVHSECMSSGLMSGPGGASDYARGARLCDGLRIVALPASARNDSRIVPAGSGHGPVSLGRMDVDIVVTEHGSADLRGCGYDERALALISIAAPTYRPSLLESWRQTTQRM